MECSVLVLLLGERRGDADIVYVFDEAPEFSAVDRKVGNA